MELSETTMDALGRALQEGDEVLLPLAGLVRFKITSIIPVVDPRAPAGQLQLRFRADALFITARGTRNQEFLRVRTAAEVRAAQGPPPRDQES